MIGTCVAFIANTLLPSNRAVKSPCLTMRMHSASKIIRWELSSVWYELLSIYLLWWQKRSKHPAVSVETHLKNESTKCDSSFYVARSPLASRNVSSKFFIVHTLHTGTHIYLRLVWTQRISPQWKRTLGRGHIRRKFRCGSCREMTNDGRTLCGKSVAPSQTVLFIATEVTSKCASILRA